MPFSVSGRSVEADVTLSASGELDIASAPELREAGESALADPRCASLRLDISGITFMDSTGLGVLIGLRNAAESASKRLVIADPSPVVARLLDLSGLSTVFIVENSH